MQPRHHHTPLVSPAEVRAPLGPLGQKLTAASFTASINLPGALLRAPQAAWCYAFHRRRWVEVRTQIWEFRVTPLKGRHRYECQACHSIRHVVR